MIRLLLRVYPGSWRRRYGEELTALISETGLSPSAAIDLVRSGLRERGRALSSELIGGAGMVIGPAWRHPTGAALLALAVLAPTLSFVAASLLAYQLGVTSIRDLIDSVNVWLAASRILDLLLVLAPAIALVFAAAPLVRLELRSGEQGREAVIGIRLRLLNVAVGLLALGIGALLVWHIVFESVMEAGA